MFSPLPVRFCFPYFLCDFFPLPCVQFFPISVLPPSLRPQTFRLFPGSLSISGFTAPFLELGVCGPRVVTNHAHTPPSEQQSSQGRLRLLNLSLITPQSTGNKGQMGLISTVKYYFLSALNRFFNKSRFSLSLETFLPSFNLLETISSSRNITFPPESDIAIFPSLFFINLILES